MNPNVDAHTHAKITTGTYENKFGIAFEKVEGVYARASQIEKPAAARLADAHRLAADRGRAVRAGGRESVAAGAAPDGSASGWNFSASAAAWASFMIPRWPAARRPGGNRRRRERHFDAGTATPLGWCRCSQPLGLKILIEPGRFIVGNAGILVTRVEYVKRTGRKNFVIVDAAMNDLDPSGVLRRLSRNCAAHARTRTARRFPPMSSARSASRAIIFARTVRCRRSAKAITWRC